MFGLLKNNNVKDYRRFRWFYTSDETLVVGGKSDEQNELVLKYFLKPQYIVVHTSSPGSPFMIIQSENPSKNDIEEASVFCACFSKKWKMLKSEKEKIGVDIFKGEQMYKTKVMKKGTFGVKGKEETLNVKPKLALVVQKGKIKAVPLVPSLKTSYKILAEIVPGKLNKNEATEKIVKKIKDKFNFPVSNEEIMQVIPSDKIGVK